MRIESVAGVKRSKKGKKLGSPLQNKPREGTILRSFYDMFLENKGIPLHGTPAEWYRAFGGKSLNAKGNTSYQATMEQLKNFYGLDIRRLKHKTYILAGEWIDGKYHDYMLKEKE